MSRTLIRGNHGSKYRISNMDFWVEIEIRIQMHALRAQISFEN